jgi:hypothetical protein
VSLSPSQEAGLIALGGKLVDIDKRLTSLRVWRAISTYRAAAKARTQLDELAPAYYEAVRSFQDSLRSGTASGPGIAMAKISIEATAAGLSNILVVQQRWASVNGLVDRKQTLALGVIGLLVAIIALVVSVIPLVAQCGFSTSGA